MKQLRAGDVGAALTGLARVWSRTNDTELAELIEQSIELETNERPAIIPAKGESLRQAWLEVAEAQDPADLGRLLRSVPEASGEVARERLETLLAWAPNPFLATSLARWLESPPFTGRTLRQCLPPLLLLLERQGDSRCLSALARLGTPAARSLHKKLAARPIPTGLSESERVLLREFRRQRSSPSKSHLSIEALFAEVYADPWANAPRLVLADALLDRGDARGELITLQIAHAGGPTAREKQLLRGMGRAWLGPLDAAAAREGLVFRRGFASALRHETHARAARCWSAAEWATIEELDLRLLKGDTVPVSKLLLGTHLKSLREVRSLQAAELARVAASERPLQWELLTVNAIDPEEPAQRSVFESATILPSLSSLAFLGWSTASTLPRVALADDLMAGRLARPVRHLGLATKYEELGMLVSLVERRALESATLHAHWPVFSARFERAARALRLDFPSASPGTFAAAAKAIDTVPRQLLAHVTLRVRGGPAAATGQLDPINRALQRFERATLTVEEPDG